MIDGGGKTRRRSSRVDRSFTQVFLLEGLVGLGLLAGILVFAVLIWVYEPDEDKIIDAIENIDVDVNVSGVNISIPDIEVNINVSDFVTPSP